MFRPLVLVFFLLLHVETAKIHISGNLICHKIYFNYLVAIKEFDWLFNNDRLYTSETYDSFYPHQYSAYTEYLESDELENNKYEIFVSFWHTCTDDGKWMYYESRVGYVSQSLRKETFLHHDVNLTNAHGELSWRDWEDWVTSNGFTNVHGQMYQTLGFQ